MPVSRYITHGMIANELVSPNVPHPDRYYPAALFSAIEIVRNTSSFRGIIDIKTGGSKGIVNIDGIIKDAENNEQTVQRMVLFTQSSYGSSPVWISQKIQISNRETAPASLIQELLPDFFLTNTSVSNVDFFALNRETYLITKEGIPYLYCQNYALPENE